MINDTDYPRCGHGAVAQVQPLGCAACLSNQRDALREALRAAQEAITMLLDRGVVVPWETACDAADRASATAAALGVVPRSP